MAEDKIKEELLKERSEGAFAELKKLNPKRQFTKYEEQAFMIGCEYGAKIGVQINKDMDDIIKSRIADDLTK